MDYAKRILETLLRKCNKLDEDEELSKTREHYFSIVVQSMVREVVSPNHTVREQVNNFCLW